jgi:hypothetical protein
MKEEKGSSLAREILVEFLTDFADRRTRPYSFAVAWRNMEVCRAELGEEAVKEVMRQMEAFAERFKTAWPWERGKVLSRALREL